ncbi:TniB family NTP-binding protein [Bacillus cereus]|uniref:TniB family NTP-binding protein n=1 Tax=Bacillus cereus TaxID=1396 RepID=UPI003B00B587
MTKAVRRRNLKNQMEVLKSLASTSETPIILFGTYDLLDFKNLSDQLSKRGKDIHLRRYSYDNDSDISSFVNVLKAF